MVRELDERERRRDLFTRRSISTFRWAAQRRGPSRAPQRRSSAIRRRTTRVADGPPGRSSAADDGRYGDPPAPQDLAYAPARHPWARIGECVGQRDLTVTANTYTHVMLEEGEFNYAELLAE